MKSEFTSWSSVAVHSGNIQDPNYAHLTPIYATSTFVFDNAEQGMERFESLDKENIYTRWGNPSFKVCEQKIAALEAFGIKNEDDTPLELKALLHASGQAAMSTLFFSNLKAGDAILSHQSLYGGSYELMTKVLAGAGIEIVILDLTDLSGLESIFKKHTNIKLVHLETPANPTIRCVDIEHITRVAKAYNALVSVDNTFATPYLQQPFKYGVDFVFHSTTKFLNGHGTSIGGILIGKNIDFMKTKAWKWYALLGGNANPFDAYLLNQGLKTLELRMLKHCENGAAVAEYLNSHMKVEHVNYVGLPSHPDFLLAKKQMRHPGPMLSFELKGGLEAGKKFIDNLQMCTRAVSLGTVDTLVSHPASMTHIGVPKEERLKYGITDGLIRMSVGIEGIKDIINDIEQAIGV